LSACSHLWWEKKKDSRQFRSTHNSDAGKEEEKYRESQIKEENFLRIFGEIFMLLDGSLKFA
jgi:hypothetical protein